MKNAHIEKPYQSKHSDKGASYEITPFGADSVGVYYRHKGSVNGKHYHTGTLPTTNPERGILVKGRATLNVKDLQTGEAESFLLVAPSVWVIFTNTYHELVAEEDIIYIEPPLEGHDPDSDKIKIDINQIKP